MRHDQIRKKSLFVTLVLICVWEMCKLISYSKTDQQKVSEEGKVYFSICTHDVGTPSEGSRGCSRRRSTATPGHRPARRSFARRCSCWVGPCPKRVSTQSRLENHILGIIYSSSLCTGLYTTLQQLRRLSVLKLFCVILRRLLKCFIVN